MSDSCLSSLGHDEGPWPVQYGEGWPLGGTSNSWGNAGSTDVTSPLGVCLEAGRGVCLDAGRLAELLEDTRGVVDKAAGVHALERASGVSEVALELLSRHRMHVPSWHWQQESTVGVRRPRSVRRGRSKATSPHKRSFLESFKVSCAPKLGPFGPTWSASCRKSDNCLLCREAS